MLHAQATACSKGPGQAREEGVGSRKIRGWPGVATSPAWTCPPAFLGEPALLRDPFQLRNLEKWGWPHFHFQERGWFEPIMDPAESVLQLLPCLTTPCRFALKSVACLSTRQTPVHLLSSWLSLHTCSAYSAKATSGLQEKPPRFRSSRISLGQIRVTSSLTHLRPG